MDWLKARTQGYENVEVVDFTDSWVDGLAFCAVIHSYCPDLINYKMLHPEDKLHNLHLAFSTAEKLGIPRLMEPEDLLAESGPDKFCVITYLAQFVDYFRPQAPTPIPTPTPAPIPAPPTDTVKQFEERGESKRQETERKNRLKRNLRKCTGTDVVQSGRVAEKVAGYESINVTKYRNGDPFILETVPTGFVAERIASFLQFQEKMNLNVEFIMVTSPRSRRRKIQMEKQGAPGKERRGGKIKKEEMSNIYYIMRDGDGKETPRGDETPGGDSTYESIGH